MSNFVDCDREQAFLLPPDLRDWIPEDDLAHFVIEAVERVGMSAFKVNHRGTGSAQYHPRMMLALLIYCYANGIFSSRRIERATHRDIGVRFVAANAHPDHDTIAAFRRQNFAAVGEGFLQVLLLAKELKLVKVGVVSVDGTKLDANGSKHRSVRYDRAGELIDQLKLEISELMARAEALDGAGEEDSQSLPREIARREALRDQLDAARRRLENQAKARAEAERQDLPEVAAARSARSALLRSTTDLMRLLTWRDFELLIELVFSQSGWRRISASGGTQKTIDIELVLPTTGEAAFVQVKSKTNQVQLDDYIERFAERDDARMFYVYHTSQNRPYLCRRQGDPRRSGPARRDGDGHGAVRLAAEKGRLTPARFERRCQSNST